MRVFQSLSFRLQSVAIFLSFVGVAFGVKGYFHVKQVMQDSAVYDSFWMDLQLQLLIAILVNAVVALVLYQIVTKPVKKLGDTLQSLIADDASVTVPYTNDKTEIGKLAVGIEAFRQSIIENQQLERAQKEMAAKAETDKKQAMRDLADRFNARTQGIIQSVTAAATQLQQSALSLLDVSKTNDAKVSTVSKASDSTAHNVNQVAEATEKLLGAVNNISQQMNLSTQAIAQTVEQVQQANHTSVMLESATQKIGEIVELIQSIAGQINLLALNATIESARAGEAGKGFAVVASEVKSLASQTSSATDQISQHIVNIQEASRQVMQVFGSIKEGIEQISSSSHSVSNAVDEQTQTTKTIASSMMSAAAGTSQINAEISDISQGSTHASSSASQVLDASKSLAQQAANLNEEVNQFLAEIRQA